MWTKQSIYLSKIETLRMFLSRHGIQVIQGKGGIYFTAQNNLGYHVVYEFDLATDTSVARMQFKDPGIAHFTAMEMSKRKNAVIER